MTNFRNKNKSQKGYIALMAVIIITTVTLAIGISINLLSISETQLGLLQEQTTSSFFVAEGCLEEAILRIKRDNGYQGGNLNLGEGSCNIQVETIRSFCNKTGEFNPNYRTIYIQSNINNFIRNLIAEVNLTEGEFNLSCWKEI